MYNSFLSIFMFFFIFQTQTAAQVLFQGNENYYDFVERIEAKKEQLSNSSLKKINRSDYLLNDRLYPTGDLSDLQSELQSQVNLNGESRVNNLVTPPWEIYGPNIIIERHSGEEFGSGRISFLKFHPSQHNQMFAGTPTGCIWESENKGASWEIYNSNLPCSGYSDLVFDPSDENIMYLLTGDYDGKTFPFYGLLRTMDGGANWEMIDIPNTAYAKILKPHPTDSGKLFLITQSNLLVSEDFGSSWTEYNTFISDVQDLEFHPTIDSIVYAISSDYTSGYLYYSENSGDSFQFIDSTKSGRVELAVEPNNPDYLYLLTPGSGGFGQISGLSEGIFKSTDRGQTFEIIEGTDELLAKQQRYNTVFEVHPADSNLIIAGWVELHISHDGGQSWASFNEFNSFIHNDQHKITFDPEDPSQIYVANDGGVYRTGDYGQTWEILNQGLYITQVYEFSNSQTCEDRVLIGTQDNGTALTLDSIWMRIGLGDGFSCHFDPINPCTFYHSYQSQNITKHTDCIGGVWNAEYLSNLPGNSNNFKTEFIVNPYAPNHLYWYTRDSLYFSDNQGDSWQGRFPLSYKNLVTAIRTSKSPENIYAVREERQFLGGGFESKFTYLLKSTDLGVSWTEQLIELDTTSGDGVVYRNNAIELDPMNPQKIWLAQNKTNSHRILFSNDEGQTWEDFSTGLPNAFINDLLYQPYSDDILYAATDIGVWFRTGSMTAWEPYNEDLPATIISNLQISNVTEKLRCSSFGSGVWETDLYDISSSPPISQFHCDTLYICQGDVINWNHFSTFNAESANWLFEGGSPSVSNNHAEDVLYEEPGSYSTRLITQNPNGNDTLTSISNVVVYNTTLKIDSLNLGNGNYQLSAEGFEHYLWSTGDTLDQIAVSMPGWYFLSAFQDSSCIAVDSIFIVDSTTGILEQSDASCTIFPNPTQNQISINCQQISDKLTYKIFDILGKVYKSATFTESVLQISLPQGSYFIEVKNEKNQPIYFEKIIVTQ